MVSTDIAIIHKDFNMETQAIHHNLMMVEGRRINVKEDHMHNAIAKNRMDQ